MGRFFRYLGRMPFEVMRDDDARLISSVAEGSSSLAEAIAEAEQLQAIVRECPGYKILLNHRRLEFLPSPSELHLIAGRLFNNQVLFRRSVALVVAPGPQEATARILVALAHMAGVELDIFTDASEAGEWLRSSKRGPC